MKLFQTMTASALAALMMHGVALADDDHLHEGDVELEVHDGEIHAHDGQVYGAELGLDAISPFDGEIDTWTGTADDPGFDSAAGTFTVGTAVGFNILDALKVWNGTAFVDTNFEMELELSSFSATTSTGFVAGPSLAVDSNGVWHEHIDFTLIDPNDGNAIPSTDDAAGVYLATFELYSTDPLVENSEPFHFVFNYADSEANHAAAIAAIPEPATAGLVALAAGGLLLRRRRA